MSEDLEAALDALVRREPRCAPFVPKLRATKDPSRVLDVLTDRPRERLFRSPVAGLVEPYRATLCVWMSDERASPRPPENPLGTWVSHPKRYDAIGWVIPKPVAQRAVSGARIEAGADLAVVWCTLDDRVEVMGDGDVKVCVGDELPELAPQESHLVAQALLQFVDSYPDADASAAKAGGELVLASEFERRVERALESGGACPVGRARVIGVTAQ